MTCIIHFVAGPGVALRPQLTPMIFFVNILALDSYNYGAVLHNTLHSRARGSRPFSRSFLA